MTEIEKKLDEALEGKPYLIVHLDILEDGTVNYQLECSKLSLPRISYISSMIQAHLLKDIINTSKKGIHDENPDHHSAQAQL